MEEEAKKVMIKNHSFNPPEINIKVGETVTWTNEDDDTHTVTSLADEEEFDSGLFGKGESYSYSFNALGEYDYHCSIHPNMKGKITVS